MTVKLDLRWLEPVSVLLALSSVQIWDFSSETCIQYMLCMTIPQVCATCMDDVGVNWL